MVDCFQSLLRIEKKHKPKHSYFTIDAPAVPKRYSTSMKTSKKEKDNKDQRKKVREVIPNFYEYQTTSFNNPGIPTANHRDGNPIVHANEEILM